MNRVDFVIRQLRYYASVRCPHIIYIGDSSPKEDSEKINSEIEKLGNKIKVKYYHLPGHNSWQAHNYLVSRMEEKNFRRLKSFMALFDFYFISSCGTLNP